MASGDTILKKGLARTVLLRRRQSADGVVVKRFHSPSSIQALRDRARAVSEHRLLTALRARDLPVPRPHAVRRHQGSWEVVMEWIPDAPPLSEVLLRPGWDPAGAPAGALATALGRLLAAVHAAGLDHPDLHPGNVLVDAGGTPWLIDFHKARLATRLEPGRLERDLVSLAAAVREVTTPRFRARAALAWARALPPELRPVAPNLAERVEDLARAHRRAVVEHRQGRWTRDSGSVTTAADGDAVLYLRRDLPPDFPRRLAEELGTSPGWRPLAAGGRRVVVLASLPWKSIRAHWYTASRLAEHRVASLAPLAARHGAKSWAAFEARGEPGAATPFAIGALLGALHDRGLDVEALTPGAIRVEAGGSAVLVPPERLLHLDPRPGACPPARRFRALDGLAGAAGGVRRDFDALLEGYLSAFRHSARETSELRSRAAPSPWRSPGRSRSS